LLENLVHGFDVRHLNIDKIQLEHFAPVAPPSRPM
jgi:hypothetical protein